MPDLEKVKIQPVGNGHIDLICPWESVETFIRRCDGEGLNGTGFTCRCHVTGDHRPCLWPGFWLEERRAGQDKRRDNT